MQASARPKIIEELRQRIHRLECFRSAGASDVPTGFAALDALLGQGGLRKGTLIEWMSASEGSGAAGLALTVAGHILREDGLFVVVDSTWGQRTGRQQCPPNAFYPPAAAALGIPLERTVVVRPETRLSALWAWEQALRCPGVAVTFGWLDALGDRLLRRLQLAVEAGGGLGFLLRPADCRDAPSWAVTRIGVTPHAEREVYCRPHAPREVHFGRQLRVSLSRGPASARDTVINLDLDNDDEAGDVHLVPELADSAAAGRPVF